MVIITKYTAATGCPACPQATTWYNQTKQTFNQAGENVFFDEEIFPTMYEVNRPIPSYDIFLTNTQTQLPRVVDSKTVAELTQIIRAAQDQDNVYLVEEEEQTIPPEVTTAAKDVGLTFIKGITWGLSLYLFSKIVAKYDK